MLSKGNSSLLLNTILVQTNKNFFFKGMSNGLGPVMAGNTTLPGLYNFLNFLRK
jgi:hypothetical protein